MPIPDPGTCPGPRRERIVLEGDVPSPITPPSRCRFHPRCRYATEICAQEEPPLVQHGTAGHMAACHHPLDTNITDHPTADASPGTAQP